MPELTRRNPLDQLVLLIEGETLLGARQDRVLDVSVLIDAGSTLTVPLI